MFYKLSDVYNQAIEDWGRYDMAIQPFIICKTRKASILRFEVTAKLGIRPFIISSECNVSDFPFLDKKRILNNRKDELTSTKSSQDKNKNNIQKHKIPLSRIPNSELINHFWVSTEWEEPKINIMSWRQVVYQSANKMANIVVKALENNYILGKYKVDYWMIDFIESSDGLTYFLQVKSFKWENLKI